MPTVFDQHFDYGPYHGGWIETAPRPTLLEWQWRKLVEHVDWLERQCPFWRVKFTQAGASAAGLRTIEDFHRLPTTDKHEQAMALEDAGATDCGGLLCRPHSEIQQNGAFIWHTTGTTGRQRAFITSFGEFKRIGVRAASRVLWMGEMRPGAMFGILAPATFWIAGLALNHACRGIGVTPLLLGPPLDTAGKLEMLRRYRPAGVFMTPTFAPRLLEVAAERGIDMQSLGTKSVILGGEVVTLECRRLIESEWKPERGVYDSGGLSETLGFMYGECDRHDGMHVFEDIHHADVVDPDDPVRPVAPGQIGELVVTSFTQRDLIAAFRFRTNDLVTYT
ncbi:MAG: phenylacetate--CoA ligase family protein, partial [Candidatus Binataceae bacterium]